MSKPWRIEVGCLVQPHPVKTNYSHHHPDYQVGVVVDVQEYPEDDLAGPVCYEVQWNGVVGSEWWMPHELVVLNK